MGERDPELGRKIALYRQRRGLSQREFAQLIGRSEAWVSQVERGIREAKSIDVLERVASVLEVPLADLAPSAPRAAAAERPSEAVPLRLLLSANYALRAVLGKQLPYDLEALRSDTERTWELAHAAQYDELVALLETLLPRLEAAAGGSEAPEVFGLLARCYHSCAAALAKLQQFDAAWVAADRAISDAGRAGDPLLMAEGAFRLTLLFQGAGQLDQAEHTVATASAALEGLVEQGIPEALSVYGALQLQRAVIAARTEHAIEARRYLDRARIVAGRLGEDRNDYETEFGPTNVALHEVAVAVDLGNAGDAIRVASEIDASGLSAERQGRLQIDIARAWTQRRNPEKALAALEVAERLTPEQVHSHRFVRTIAQDLLLMEPDNPRLREFAARAGIVT
jgi:transcriptional regulator with XRE-family HTH domain